MLYKFRTLVYSLLVGAILAACAGEDGEPGPQGDLGERGDVGDQGTKGQAGLGTATKTGFLEGTVAGMRKDGTAFNEAFKYEYTFENTQTSSQGVGGKYYHATRFLSANGYSPYLYLNMIQVSEGVFKPAYTSWGMEFNFQKELSADALFEINAVPYFAATPGYTMELAPEQNAAYHFGTDSEGGLSYYSGTFNSTSVYRFSAYDDNFSYQVNYNQTTGALVSIIDNYTDATITSGAIFDLYNKLKFKMNTAINTRVFYDATTNASLHVVFPDVPADQFTVTNFVHDTATGVVTFDFVLKISGVGSNNDRTNTTGHDLTISGKYNSGGKVFQNVVNRVRG